MPSQENKAKNTGFFKILYIYLLKCLVNLTGIQRNFSEAKKKKGKNQEIFNPDDYLKAKAIICFNDLCPSL